MIRITKRQSAIITILSITLFFASGYYLVRHNAQVNKLAVGTLRKVTEITVDDSRSGFSLGNFHRTQSKDGKKAWEITATNGQYFTDSDSAVLSDALIVIYQKNGDVVEVKSQNATLQFEKNALKKAELRHSVRMNVNKERFVFTESADFNQPENTIVAPGYAKIEDQKMILEGEYLKVNLSDDVLEYGKNVKTQIKAVEQTRPKL